MLGLSPFDMQSPFYQQPIRAPPSRQESFYVDLQRPRAESVEPSVRKETLPDAYIIALTAPNETCTIADGRAVLEDDGIVLKGTLVQEDSGYEYVSRRRTGVYAEPDQRALVGMIPSGLRFEGGAPTGSGWIALNDDESWVFDDGSLALVRQPNPHPPSAFAKKLTLPADAVLRRATAQRKLHGGVLVTVPRVRRAPAAQPHPMPVPIKSSPPAPCTVPNRASAPSQPPAAKPPASTGPPPGVSADEYKQAHKRHVAARRASSAASTSTGGSGSEAALEALRALHGDASHAGPVLIECPASEAGERNVQSPTEAMEEWVAIADGGFMRGDGDDCGGTPSSAKLGRWQRPASKG